MTESISTPGIAELAARRAMSVLMLAGTIAARRSDFPGLAKKWESAGRFDPDDFDKKVTATFVDVVRKPMGPLLSSMLQLGRKGMADTLEVDIEQQRSALKIADAWARKYADQVASELGETNKLVIARVLPEWMSKRMTAGALANRAKELYGLDPRSATSYLAYANSDAKRKDLIGLAEKYLENRANVVGAVHSFTALNMGRQMLLAEGVAQGHLGKNARKVWVTALDERVCDECGPMDGVSVPVLNRFSVLRPLTREDQRGKRRRQIRLTVPPVHPNCRCTVVLEKKFREGMITRTARFSDVGPDHLGRLVSRVEDIVRQ